MDEVLASLRRCGESESASITGLEPTQRAPVSDSASLRSQMRRASRTLGSKSATVAAVVGSLAVFGWVGFVAMQRVGRPSVRRPPLATASVAAPTVAAPSVTSTAVTASTFATTPTGAVPLPVASVAATAFASVKIRVSTDPDGASVKENGVELCSNTPCEILYDGDDADPAREHKLAFSRPGYRAEVRSVNVGEGPVSMKLTPLSSRSIPTASQKTEEMPPVPTGYKTEIPY